MTVPPTEWDRETARHIIKAPGVWTLDGDEQDNWIEAIAHTLANERERALRPFRDLEDGYPLGANVPVYRISRAIEEVQRPAAKGCGECTPDGNGPCPYGCRLNTSPHTCDGACRLTHGGPR